METWVVVGAVLLSVLVGALLPVLAQLFLTLRSVRRLVDQLEPKLDATLVQAQEAAGRINRAGAGLEAGVNSAKRLVDTADQLARTIRRLSASLRTAAAIGGAVGPAVAAAIRAIAEGRAAKNPSEGAAQQAQPKPDEQPTAEGEQA